VPFIVSVRMRASVAVAVCLLLGVVGALAQTPGGGDEMPECGYLLGWEETSMFDGWAAQSLDIASTQLSDLYNITLEDDGEMTVSAVHARAQRSIFFFSTSNVYQYQVDEGQVVNKMSYSNDDAAFTALGYDDVTGHFWGSQWDDVEEMYFAAKYDPGTNEITQFSYIINNYDNSTLYLDSAQKVFYHLVVFNDNGDDDDNAYVSVNITNFDFDYHYNVSAAFFETEWVFPVSNEHPFPNGNALLLDSNSNYILFNLESGDYNYVDPDVISQDIFFPSPEPFYNYAFGFYDFDSDCETEGVLCLGFYDTLDFTVSSVGPLSFDDTDVIHPNEYFYYSDGC